MAPRGMQLRRRAAVWERRVQEELEEGLIKESARRKGISWAGHGKTWIAMRIRHGMVKNAG